MKQSEFVLKSLVTRLNGLLNGRHIDELDEYEYTLYQDRCFAIKLIADTFGYKIITKDLDGSYIFSYER